MNKNLCTIPSCRNYQKYCRLHLSESFTPAAKINKVADSQKEANTRYKKIARQFITSHPKCQVKGCKKPSECVHHMKGRVGDLLSDTKNFLAVCMEHHRQIEENPEWAKKEGYSKSRLKETV